MGSCTAWPLLTAKMLLKDGKNAGAAFSANRSLLCNVCATLKKLALQRLRYAKEAELRSLLRQFDNWLRSFVSETSALKRSKRY